MRDALGLRNPDSPTSPTDSLLPTGSRTITPKDVVIALALLAQVGWFFLSLTDPLGAPNPILNEALTAGGEWADRREARRAERDAEYAAMLRNAVESGEAPPPCATRKLGDPEGGCGADPEFARTRGLDANRGWISGPPASEDTL